MDKVEQRHREIAAAKIDGSCKKGKEIIKRILDGKADHHPSVQAAVFYNKLGEE